MTLLTHATLGVPRCAAAADPLTDGCSARIRPCAPAPGPSRRYFRLRRYRGRRAADVRASHPKRRPFAVNVQPLAAMVASTAALEVRYSYSRSSWR